MRSRVVVTGLGVVSPIGSTLEKYWQALLYERSLPVRHEAFAGTMENTLVYRVTDEAGPPARDGMGRATALAVRAVRSALADAGLSQPSGIVGVAMGTGLGDVDLPEMERAGGRPVDPLQAHAYRVSALVAREFGLTGPNLTVSSACAAGCYSLDLAAQAIGHGWADVMVAGGVEILSRVVQGCFHRMGALDPQLCRPFDESRAGTLYGEGAAVLVLEAEEHARRRGWLNWYAEVEGFGWSCDAQHTTAPDAEGTQALRAIRSALAQAGIQVEEIDCVLPNGTGTPVSDLIEATTLERLLGERAEQVLCTAIKSKLGHSGGAAGAFSCLTGALILKHGLVPPTANLARADPQCRLRLVAGEPARTAAKTVLITVNAFGGNNAAVVMGRADV
jgi:3-oxoacyl-[acyl-carrier-protein] synthase II